MPPIIRGRLISSAFAADVLPTLPWMTAPPAAVRHGMDRCGEQIERSLGSVSSVRQIADIAVVPLLTLLGLTILVREDEPSRSRVHTAYRGDAGPLWLVSGWGDSLDHAWRASVHAAIAGDARWAICCNGVVLRVVDARRTWSRDHVEFDLVAALTDRQGQALLWSLMRGESLVRIVAPLDEAIALSSRHGADVCRSLGRGVLDALALLLSGLRRPRTLALPPLFEQSLTVLYRVLFLLFAEARGLVPLWHPVYRDRYSLDALVTAMLGGRACRGLWHAVQAITRLAHHGCAAGDLKVTAFNGRLFSPAQAAEFDRLPIEDAVMRGVVMAVSSVPGSSSRARTRIAYRDLDVEQLGAVYEQVLDYEPSPSPGLPLVRTRDLRKSSGAFYTPRGLTAFLVRQTLAPLVRGRTFEQILDLRIVDPAMGSGAFLVAACRYLASAAEDALIAEGRWHEGDVTPGDRALLRREIAARCLYGVDLNPMAVQLARLSLWLATLASDKPLSFLDHHLLAGDSLLGASPDDVRRQPSRGAGRPGRIQVLPLFEDSGLSESLADVAERRARLAREPDDTAAIVREKERTLAALSKPSTPLGRWWRVLDLWCAGWFWSDGRSPDRGTCADLAQQLLTGRAALRPQVSGPLLAHSAELAATHRFFHWPLAFPEVFAGTGFDAVIGNPPWDMVRGDSGTGGARDARQRHARQAMTFFRESGVYRVEGRGHANRYQLFVERALQLLRPGGRLGLVVPSGAVSDAGSAALRRHLFDRADVDSITGMDNRGGIFPIHRSVRFALLTATAGRPTTRVSCRFGLTRVDDLEAPGQEVLDVSRDLLARLSGADDLGVPDLSSRRDLRIVERITAGIPALGDPRGWGVRFGRELNATDDRAAFSARSNDPNARPVVEGKQLDPFHVDLTRSELELGPDSAAGARAPRRPRLAYREVASATNRLTLIAAILPARAVTIHTVFCLKTPIRLCHQQVLCAFLNSYVANYLIRLRVNTHVTATLMSRLPVPVIDANDPAFVRLQHLSEVLAGCNQPETTPAYVELQAVIARMYSLSAEDFEHILTTFPLIPPATRQAALNQFERTQHTEAPRL